MRGYWFLGLAALCVASLARAEETRPLATVVHVHTGVSDGVWTPRHVAEEAQRLGVDVVIFGDSLLERWEYGLPPLRHVVRRVFEQPSVLRWGPAAYVEHMRAITHDVPAVLTIPGVSVAPFYRWSNIPLLRGGVLEGWHRQLLVVGLHDPQAFTDLPAVSNVYGSWHVVLRHPWKCWPLAIIAWGLVLWWRTGARRPPAISVWLLLVGALCAWNADLRATSTFQPYQRDPGAPPYQAVIDHVTQRGGLVFWSHPEMASHGAFMGVPVMTEPYLHLLWQTRGYAGFGMNYVGYLQWLDPGQGWDQLLLAHCRGRRMQPAWVIGEIGFHDASRPLNMVETFVYATAKTEAAVLAALRAGHMYAQFNRRDGADVQLTRYAVVDDAAPQTAGMGDTLAVTGPVRVTLAGTQHADDEPLVATIVRDGTVIHEERLRTTPFTLDWRDEPRAMAAPHYYRAMLRHGESYVFTNPTFVRRAHVP